MKLIQALSVSQHLLDVHSTQGTVMPVGSAQRAAFDDMISAAVRDWKRT